MATNAINRVLVERLEGDPAVAQARLVVRVAHGDPGDEVIQPYGFRVAELAVLQVDVVDDFSDLRQGPVPKREPAQQDLEGAPLTLVGEVGLEHVEAQLSRRGRARLRLGLWRPQGRLDRGQQPFEGVSATRCEEVDKGDLREPLSKPPQDRRDLLLGSAGAFPATAHARLKRTGLAGKRPVVRLTSRVEERLDRGVLEPLHEARFANRGIAPAGDDLPAHPLEVLEGLLALGQHIHGVLHRHGAEPLQAPAHLHPQVAGLGRNLVNEDEPASVGWFGHEGNDSTTERLR